MLIHPFTVLATAVSLAAAVAGAPFPLASLMPRRPADGKPAFTKVPYRRVPHRGRKYGKRQIAEGLEAAVYGSAYAAELSIGTPPQDFWIQLDTGSSDVYVHGPTFQPYDDPVYYPGNSSTSRRTGVNNITLSYGGGDNYGDQYVDTINFCGFPIEDFPFIVVTDEQASDVDPPGISGLIGLAGSLGTTANDDAFLQSLLDQQQVEYIAFSFAIQSKTFGEGPLESPGGTFTLGTSFDSSQYHGSLYTVNVSLAEGQRWTLPFSGGYFDNIGFAAGYAVIDSGTTLLEAPSDVVNAIYGVVPGAFFSQDQEAWIIPCNSSFSRFEFIFGGNAFSLGPNDLVAGSADNASDPNLCMGSLSSSNTDFWILGDYFMRNYFVGFLFGPYPSISFAELPAGGAPEASTTSAGIPGPTSIASSVSVHVPLPPTSFASPAATESGAALATTKAGATQSVLIASSTSAAGGRGGNGKSNGAMAMSVAGADWLALLLTTAGGLVALLVVVL